MARIDVNFTVEKQILTQTPDTYLYTGSQDYFYAIFDVDATWNNVNTIKALFIKNGVSKIVDLERCDGGYGCDIPWQMYSTTGDFKVSVYDGDRMSTNSIYVVVDEKDEIKVEEPADETYADRLMAHFSLREVDRPDTFKIDGNTRVITPPASFNNFGVESDENTNRVWFEVPLYVGDGIDLSTLNLYINYQNANGEKDKYIVEDASEMDGVLYFSWVLSRKATQYKGDITFVVCAIGTDENGKIETEWNTTLCTGSVLEGLEVENPIVPIETVDLIDQLVSLAKNSVADVENAVAQAEADIEFAHEQAIVDINDTKDAIVAEVQTAGEEAVNRMETTGGLLFANALKSTVSGNPIFITDASPIEHEMTVTENNGGVEIIRTGRNIVELFGRSAVEFEYYTDASTTRNFEFDKYYLNITSTNVIQNKGTVTAKLVDGVWEVTSTIKNFGIGFPVRAFPNTRYSCSAITNGGLSLGLYTSEGVFIKAQSTTNSFVTPSNCGIIVVCLLASTVDATYSFENVQLEFGSEKTEHEPYVEPIAYMSNKEPIKIPSLCPTTVLVTESGSTITAEYNRDLNKVIANLESALISSTGV